jgi:hypothetical protein
VKVFFLITTVLVLAAQAQANCPRQLTAPLAKLKLLQCQFDPRLNGAYILYQPKALGISVGFFPMQKRQLRPMPIAQRGVGFRLLDFHLAGKTLKSALVDLDHDGQKEFLFSVTGAFNGVFQGIKLGNATDKDFQELPFEVIKQGGRSKHGELHHSAIHPVKVTTNRITAVVENKDQGQSQLYDVQYSWDGKKQVFLAKGRSRKQ